VKILPAVLLILLSGCIATTDFEMVRQDVNALMRESIEVKKDIESLQNRAAGTVKENSLTAVRESQAEINSKLSDIAMGLQELRGRFEENKYFIEQKVNETSSETDVLKARIASVENEIQLLKNKFGVTELSRKIPKPSEEQPLPEETIQSQEEFSEQIIPESKLQPAVKMEKTEAYEIAYQAFRDKKYKEARGLFEDFLKDYPENNLTDNARFWIAETYYAEGDYESAILSYETLFKKHPDSEKTSGALMKQGFSFIEIGDKKTGRIILEKLIEKFPNSKEAGLARSRLK
jgi:tol-pal system protein YbgF